jgi:hypothetical protein
MSTCNVGVVTTTQLQQAAYQASSAKALQQEHRHCSRNTGTAAGAQAPQQEHRHCSRNTGTAAGAQALRQEHRHCAALCMQPGACMLAGSASGGAAAAGSASGATPPDGCRQQLRQRAQALGHWQDAVPAVPVSAAAAAQGMHVTQGMHAAQPTAAPVLPT